MPKRTSRARKKPNAGEKTCSSARSVILVSTLLFAVYVLIDVRFMKTSTDRANSDKSLLRGTSLEVPPSAPRRQSNIESGIQTSVGLVRNDFGVLVDEIVLAESTGTAPGVKAPNTFQAFPLLPELPALPAFPAAAVPARGTARAEHFFFAPAIGSAAATPPTVAPAGYSKEGSGGEGGVETLLSEGRPVKADVRGNLGPPGVITSERVDDWIKDR